MDKKIKINLFVFLLLELAFIAAGFWLFWKNDNLSKEVIKAKEADRNLELKISNYDKIASEYAKLEEKEEIAWRFTSKDEPVFFIKEVEKAAVESNLELTIEVYEPKFTSKKEKEEQEKIKKEGKAPLAFSLTTKSNLTSFLRFLIKLENLGKYADLKTIGLEKRTLQANKEAPIEEYIEGKIVIYAR
jgi:hypothetical protein